MFFINKSNRFLKLSPTLVDLFTPFGATTKVDTKVVELKDCRVFVFFVSRYVADGQRMPGGQM